MTLPRSKLIDDTRPGYYHLFTRCVRRAWLCGLDPLTGRSFEHRRAWIEERILFLCEKFAVELYSYAILSNHYHIVLRLDPLAPKTWTDREVAERWAELCPMRPDPHAETRHAARIQAILQDPNALARYRKRLGSISWLMRLLNENIARRANREDGCKGRFWESRFGSQALLDDDASLSASVYVDLNPIRSGASRDALRAPHTSIHLRLTRTGAAPSSPDRLPPVATGNPRPDSGLSIGFAAYCELLTWTAAHAYRGQRGHDPPPREVERRGGAAAWLARISALRHRDRRAFGLPTSLRAYSKLLGQRWLRGMPEARRLVTLASKPSESS